MPSKVPELSGRVHVCLSPCLSLEGSPCIRDPRGGVTYSCPWRKIFLQSRRDQGESRGDFKGREKSWLVYPELGCADDVEWCHLRGGPGARRRPPAQGRTHSFLRCRRGSFHPWGGRERKGGSPPRKQTVSVGKKTDSQSRDPERRMTPLSSLPVTLVGQRTLYRKYRSWWKHGRRVYRGRSLSTSRRKGVLNPPGPFRTNRVSTPKVVSRILIK